jgi:HAD domain in Swiss Army Knife RNA repair proteins
MQNKSSPIVFLDMDGVMNNRKAFADALKTPPVYPPGNISFMTVDPLCVLRLKKWIIDNKADIVMSTSWRSNKMDDGGWEAPTERSQAANHDIWRALSWGGWPDVSNYLIGNTPKIYEKPRGAEIQAWLEAHPERYKSGETPYLILDDCSDMTNSQKKYNFIKTNPDEGLLDSDVLLMDALLDRQILFINKKNSLKPKF